MLGASDDNLAFHDRAQVFEITFEVRLDFLCCILGRGSKRFKHFTQVAHVDTVLVEKFLHRL